MTGLEWRVNQKEDSRSSPGLIIIVVALLFFRPRLVGGGLFARLFNIDLCGVRKSVSSDGDNFIAGLQAGGDLHLVPLLDSNLYRFLVRPAVWAGDHYGRRAVLASEYGR